MEPPSRLSIAAYPITKTEDKRDLCGYESSRIRDPVTSLPPVGFQKLTQESAKIPTQRAAGRPGSPAAGLSPGWAAFHWVLGWKRPETERGWSEGRSDPGEEGGWR
jgi:hypothetical protein